MANKFIVFCLIVLVLWGCVKDTTLDPGLECMVVVEFVLTEDNVQTLYLSKTRGHDEIEYPTINEVEIKLTDITKRFETDQFVRTDDNQWTLEYSGIPGHLYRLEVQVDGQDSVWAEQKMPESVELIRAAIGHVTIPPDYVGYGAYYYIDDVPEFLLIRGEKKGKGSDDFLPVEELCSDYPGVEDINATGKFYDGNPKWRTGTALEENLEYFDSPVAGMVGDWSYMFPNLIGKELHKDFLFISRVDDNHAGLDKLYDFSGGKGFCISGSFDITQVNRDSNRHIINYNEYLIYSSISTDYCLFMRDVYQYKKVHETDDLSSIYLRDNIHSNIHGGLGVFGAMTSNKMEFYGNNQLLHNNY